MQIPSYQIQNVLKVYSRQLTQGKILSRSNKFGSDIKTSADSVTISSEGKRQAIIDKVATSIVDRIITEGPKEKSEEIITSQIEKEIGKKIKNNLPIPWWMKIIKKQPTLCLLKIQNLLLTE